MGLYFGATRQFEKDLKRLSKRYRSLFDDLAPILDSIKKGQCIGTLLTESEIFKAFKVRFVNTTINEGKTSGFRLIYAHFEGENCNLAIALSLYCKQDVANISDRELVRLFSEAHKTFTPAWICLFSKLKNPSNTHEQQPVPQNPLHQALDHRAGAVTTIHLLGSEGFIGRALQRENGGFQLHCWSHLHSDPQHRFDLLDSSTWQALIKCQPTHVILLSWPGLPNYQELFHVSRNLPACVELIEQLAEAGLQRLVVAGTCYEYGLQNGQLKEEQFTDPVNCYSIAKDSLRRVIASRYSQQDLRWCWARIFYPFGQGQNPKSLLPSLLKALETGAESFPMGSGRQLRDFIDVQKVARHLLLLSIHQNAVGIYNVGSSIPRSVFEVAEETIAAHGGTIRLKRGVYPDRSDEPLAFWAHMDKFQDLQSIPQTQP